ncbi:MAG: fibronectin type III domain-containing protein, partial [Gammaproteobacteria bacterium]
FIPSTAPAAPTLESPTVLSRSLALKWSAPTDTGGEDITGYKVRWATADAPVAYLSAGGADGDDVPGGAAALSHTITALSDGIAYQVQVAAANTHGGGDWSAAQSATPATGVIKQVICITRRDREVASFEQCKTIAAAGFSIPKSAGAQLLKITVYFFQPAIATIFIVQMRRMDDPLNPLVADVDIDGALPNIGDWRPSVFGKRSAAFDFAITPKASGNGGRFDIGILPAVTGQIDDEDLVNLAPNELQGTFLQVVDAGMNFTEAAANGACPATNGGAASMLTLAEGGDAGAVCLSLASDPGAEVVSVGCVAEPNALGMAALEVTPPALSFTSANWQLGQAVRMRAPDNDNSAGATGAVTLRCTTTTASAAPSVYSNLSEEFAVTLTDSDIVSATGALSAAGNISENGGAQLVEITATLGGGIAPQTDCTVTMAIGTSEIAGSGGNALAAAPGDYAALTPPAITIAAGTLSGSAMLEITPALDSDSDRESIPLTATAMACGGTATVDFGAAEIVILDTGIRISDANTDGSCPDPHNSDSSGISLEEGGADDASGVLCVSLLLEPDSNVEVACAGAASAGLFTAAPAMLAFTAANHAAAQAVTLQAVDNNLSATTVAPAAALTCTASAAAASGYSGISAEVTITITDTDAPDVVSSAGATLSATSTQKGDRLNQGLTLITATLGGSIAPAEDCTVMLSLKSAPIAGTRADERAMAGEDYTGFALAGITIAAGETSGEDLYLIGTGDATDRDHQVEGIPIAGVSPSCGGVSNLVFADAEILLLSVRFLFSRANANGACPAEPGAAIPSATLALVEGESATLCARLAADPAFDGVAALDIAPSCSLLARDISLSRANLPAFTTGAGGTWKAGHAFTVTALPNDISDGDRTSNFSCSTGASIAYGAHKSFGTTAAVSISDDDSVSTSGTLTAGSIGENGGAQMVRITATLDGTARPAADCAVTVSIGSSAIDGSGGGALAASPGDYSGMLTAPVISIPAGELSGSALLAITPVVDADDITESIPLGASAACGGVGMGAGSGGVTRIAAHGSEMVSFGSAEILIYDFDFGMLDGVDGAAYTDGILVARYLAGVRGAALTAGLGLADEAGVAARATAVIAGNLRLLDVDGVNGTTAADGIMIARYFFGVTSGAGLYEGQADSTHEETVIDNIMNNLQ